MEFLLTLEDYSVFKNNLDDYYNENAGGDKRDFLSFLARMQESTTGLQQMCCGEVFSFVSVKLNADDLSRAISALSLVMSRKTDKVEAFKVKTIILRLMEIYQVA
jgi:hypothetical protein